MTDAEPGRDETAVARIVRPSSDQDGASDWNRSGGGAVARTRAFVPSAEATINSVVPRAIDPRMNAISRASGENVTGLSTSSIRRTAVPPRTGTLNSDATPPEPGYAL